MKILYVEDNEDNIYMLSMRLRRREYDVIIARSGVAGIEAAKRERPALILMDLSLPDLDGWAASRQLRADNSTRDIPIIALSAHAMESDRAAAIAAGCDDYEAKPVDFPRLIAKIEHLLANSRARDKQ